MLFWPVSEKRSHASQSRTRQISFVLQAQDEAFIHEKGYCVWYGQCLKNEEGQSLNCLYNGPAKILNDTNGISLLHKLCPKFSPHRLTCCDKNQLQALNDNLDTLRQFTGRCPACFQNLLDLFCESTCSPDQSLFMDPNGTVGFPPLESILRIKYYVSAEYKYGLFDSCKNVVFPGDNEKALNLLCGESAETCTPEKLLTHMGSTSNGYSPFDIIFPQNISLSQNLTWMNHTIFPCNESFVNPWTNKSETACSCQDCAESCPYLPPVPPAPIPRTILGLRLLSFSLLIIYLVFFFTFMPISFYLICRNQSHYTRLSDGPAPVPSSMPYTNGQSPNAINVRLARKPGVCERMGFWMDRKLRVIFSSWGHWCSSHPFIVIIVCIIFVGVLAGGLKFYKVTKNPVDLWSAPGSRARKEKDLYDSKFTPFYRTEQLIITANPNYPQNHTGYRRYPDDKFIPFGDISHLDLLNQVRNLEFRKWEWIFQQPYNLLGGLHTDAIL